MIDSQTNISRTPYYDVLNICACIAVVAIHHNDCALSFSTSKVWAESMIAQVLFFWAVPVFFMLSGAHLLDYKSRYSTNTFFKKRFTNIFVPFIIWSTLWFIYRVCNGWDFSIKCFLDGIIYYRAQPVYWFFLPLFGLYLLFPVLSDLADDFKNLKYFALLLFVTSGILPMLLEIFHKPQMDVLNNYIAMPVFYAVMGYLLSNGFIKNTKANHILLFLITVICWIFRYCFTYYCSIEMNEKCPILFNYAYVTASIPAIFIFVLARDLTPSSLSSRFVNIIAEISKCGFGIYLLHRVIMTIELHFLNMEITDFFWRTFMFPVTYLTSLTIVYFSKKSKIGNILFP